LAPLDRGTIFSLVDRELQWSDLTANWLRGLVAVGGGAVIVIGQWSGGGRGGVPADDKFQVIWRLCNQRNDEAAIKVPGPNVDNLKEKMYKLIKC